MRPLACLNASRSLSTNVFTHAKRSVIQRSYFFPCKIGKMCPYGGTMVIPVIGNLKLM